MTDDDERLIITRDEHLRMRAQEYLTSVGNYMFPILAESDRPGLLDLWGTGIAVQKNGKYYLCTAEHTIKRLLGNEGREIFIGTGDIDTPGSVYLLPLAYNTHWRFHTTAALDLAVLPIPKLLDGLTFFPFEKISRGYAPAMRSHYFLAGYPVSQNKLRDVNPRGEPKRTGILSVIVSIDQALDFKADGMNTTDFLGFKYQKVYVEGELHEFGVGLRGVSGGGLWFFPNEVIENPYLAGVFIEWHKSKNGYATLGKHLKDLFD